MKHGGPTSERYESDTSRRRIGHGLAHLRDAYSDEGRGWEPAGDQPGPRHARESAPTPPEITVMRNPHTMRHSIKKGSPFRRSVHGAMSWILALVLGPAWAVAADWPQWRGEKRDGKSAETGLLATWPEGGPPLAWQAKGVGAGYSSLAVGGGLIFTLGDLADGQYVVALSRDGGDHRWQTKIGPTWKDKFLGARSTPTYDGERVYALSTDGELVCLRAKDGELVWKRNLPSAFGGRMMKTQSGTDWRFSESPLVDGDKVIVTPGTAEAALVALDKRTGKELWRTAMPSFSDNGTDGAGYSSVVVSNGAGVRQYVQLLGRGVIGVDAATGKFLWGYGRVANDVANIATPLIDGDHVFVSTGYGTGSALLALEKTGAGVRAREVYFLEADTLQNHHGGLILHEGTVYTGTGHNKGFPIAVSLADGTVAWGPVRNEGRSSAAIAFADGRLYLRYQEGRMILAEATTEGYRERGTFVIPNVDQFSWSHPVIAGGHLYLREQDNIYCYDIRSKARERSAVSAP